MMTSPPRSSSKRIRPASTPPAPAKKLSKPAGKAKKPSKDAAKVKAKMKVMVTAEEMAMKTRPQIATTATITIKRTAIEYDDQLAKTAGGYTIAPGTPPIVPPNGDTLLHLVFFAIFSSEGQRLFEANGPESKATPDLAKASLKAELLARFPTLTDANRPGLLDTVIDAHFAADWYVEAYESGDTARKLAQQQAYSQKLLAILGELHDDALAHEFSMLW
jgi:hypothetical protein